MTNLLIFNYKLFVINSLIGVLLSEMVFILIEDKNAFSNQKRRNRFDSGAFDNFLSSLDLKNRLSFDGLAVKNRNNRLGVAKV